MPKPKDTLSNESGNDKKKAPTGLGWASKLMGKAADKMANRSIFGDMKSGPVAAADVPALLLTRAPGGGINNAQLNVINMPFVSPDSGNTHQIEGYHLPAQPGKPTMVFFGGTDMDRSAPHYKSLIKTMAEDAKRQGTGLIVMDYPSNANEGKIKAQVDQMQQHMANNMGIPLNQQAYAGYSLGGNPALYAARTNPDAAGLHLTSTVSSIRQESKNAMAAAGSITKMADKGQLSTLMDNIDETRNLIATQQNRPGGPMPVSIVYSNQERFGEAGNNHMAPLLNEFNNYPGGGVKVAVNTMAVGANEDAHQVILSTPENIMSMSDFIRDADQSVQARQALPAPGVAPVVPAVGPGVAPVVAPPVPGVTPVMPAGPRAAPGLMGEHRAVAPPIPAPVPPAPPLPVADHDADQESLTNSTDDTTSLSESEEEEVDLDALGIKFDDDDDLGPDALEADKKEVAVGGGKVDARGDDMEEEFDDFDLDVQLSQETPQRELRPHQAPEPGTQEMKPLGQKYVEGEKNIPSRTTQVGDNEVSVKEKEWLRQMSNEARGAAGLGDFSKEEWAEKKNAGTTLYMDEEQREEAKVGFANQDNPSAADGTSVAVTDKDGQDLEGRNIFVMDQEGQMYSYNEPDSTGSLKEGAAPDMPGNVPGKQVHVHHSSFLAGEDVAAAGEFVVGENTVLRDQPLSQEEAEELGVDAKTAEVSVLKEVNNRSGHYQPGAQQALQSLDQFGRQGVDMDNTKFTLHRSGDDGGPTTVDGMAKEFMQGRATPEELQNAAGDEELTTKLQGAAEKTFVARHDVMNELKQGQPDLKRVNRDDLPDERSTDKPKIDFDDEDDEGVALDFNDEDSGYAVKSDDTVEQKSAPGGYSASDDDSDLDVNEEEEELDLDEDVSNEVGVNEPVEQKQKTAPAGYSTDDEDFTLDVDTEEPAVDEEEVDETLDVPQNDAKQAQSSPAVPTPAEDGPAPKAPSVRDSLRATPQKQGGFQQGVKPNSVRDNVKVDIGTQRATPSGPKVGG